MGAATSVTGIANGESGTSVARSAVTALALMEAACNGDPDFDVWEQPWLAAAFQLLSEDPCRGECNLIDRQNMFNAIIPAFSKIVALFSLVQGKYPDMLVEELDYFYQDVNEVMRLNWRKHLETGGKGGHSHTWFCHTRGS